MRPAACTPPGLGPVRAACKSEANTGAASFRLLGDPPRGPFCICSSPACWRLEQSGSEEPGQPGHHPQRLLDSPWLDSERLQAGCGVPVEGRITTLAPVDGPPGHAGGASGGCPPQSHPPGLLGLEGLSLVGWSCQGVPGLPVPGKSWTLLMARRCERPTVGHGKPLPHVSLDAPLRPAQGWSESPETGRPRLGEVGDVPMVLAWVSGRVGTWPDWWGGAGLRLLGLGQRRRPCGGTNWGGGQEGKAKRCEAPAKCPGSWDGAHCAAREQPDPDPRPEGLCEERTPAVEAHRAHGHHRQASPPALGSALRGTWCLSRLGLDTPWASLVFQDLLGQERSEPSPGLSGLGDKHSSVGGVSSSRRQAGLG